MRDYFIIDGEHITAVLDLPLFEVIELLKNPGLLAPVTEATREDVVERLEIELVIRRLGLH